MDDLAKYFERLEGKHNVKLLLTGDHHNYCFEQRHGVAFVTAAGMARGEEGDCDAMTLWIYSDRLRLDRYVIPKGSRMNPIKGPQTIWKCRGRFSEYRRPTPEAESAANRGGGKRPTDRSSVLGLWALSADSKPRNGLP